jgi:hypothetical protein
MGLGTRDRRAHSHADVRGAGKRPRRRCNLVPTSLLVDAASSWRFHERFLARADAPDSCWSETSGKIS